MFEMTVGASTGSFKIVLPTSFVGFLLRHLKAAQSKKISIFAISPTPVFANGFSIATLTWL